MSQPLQRKRLKRQPVAFKRSVKMAKKVTVKELEEIIRFGADKLHSLGDS